MLFSQNFSNYTIGGVICQELFLGGLVELVKRRSLSRKLPKVLREDGRARAK